MSSKVKKKIGRNRQSVNGWSTQRERANSTSRIRRVPTIKWYAVRFMICDDSICIEMQHSSQPDVPSEMGNLLHEI